MRWPLRRISLIYPKNFASQAVAGRNGVRFEKMGLHRGASVMVFRTS